MRATDVVSGEAGGITQHIGAYQIKTKAGNQITFLDTPGHAAFTEMRARGANVTDICVIVVAADDAIMPQTIEAINHAKAAEVPIIVAINKIDLPAADANKVRQDLLQYSVVVEELSGDVQCVEISAKNKTNLDKLEEAIMLQAELLELKANPDRSAQGFVVEAKLEKGRGSAIAGSLNKMVEENAEEHSDIQVDILHTGVGGITESDVTLANASGGIIIGFNVRANVQARELAAREGIDIRYYNVIYDVIDDAKSILSGMLPPAMREEYLGQAKIKEVFNITKVGKIAGCEVVTGMVKRGSKVRLLRDDVVIHEGMLKTLKRHKDEVKEVKEGMECGMAFEKYEDLKAGDIIECFEVIAEQRTVQ